MRFGVLGPLQVTEGTQPIDIGGPRQRRLLAVLLANRDDIVPTDRLIEIVFEHDPPEGAAGTMRTYIARLRKALSGHAALDQAAITTRPPGYGFVSNGHVFDVAEFFEGVGAGSRQRRDDPIGAITTLEQALNLWRGGAYEEFVYEDWAQPEIARLEEARLAALEDLAEAKLDCGLHKEVVPELRRHAPARPRRP